MKLYTEEQVMNMILKAFEAKSTTTVNDILKQVTPIELPSDEEIAKMVGRGGSDYEGAIWMRDKILKQTK